MNKLKSIFSILIFILSFQVLKAQCYDVCKKGPGNRKNVLKEKIINKIDKNQYEAAFEKIDNILKHEGTGYFNEVHIGIGCFYFYYSYARLAAKIDEDPTFKKFIQKNYSENIVKERGKIAANYAEKIYEKYNNYPCPKLLEELAGKKGEKWRKYKSELDIISEKFNGYLDISINEFKLSEENEKLIANIKLKNIGTKSTQKPFSIIFELLENEATNSIQIKSLMPQEIITQRIVLESPSSGRYIARVKVNINEKERDNNNNKRIKKFSIKPINEPVVEDIPRQESYTYKISTNKNNYINVDEIQVSNYSRSCVELEHYFDILTFEHSTSEITNTTFLKDILAPYINSNQIKNIHFTITGYTDGRPVQNGLNHNLGKIVDEWYYKSGSSTRQLMKNFSKVTNNEQLAFIRAYLAKIYLLRYLNIDNSQISITTQQNSSYEAQNRKVNILICSNEFTKSDLTSLRISSKIKLPYQLTDTKDLIFSGFNFQNAPLGKIFPIKHLLFDVNDSTIQEKYFPILNTLYQALDFHRDINVEIGGHTNYNCDEDYCDKLSYKRANAVAKYLTDKGIESKRLVIKGYGKSNPITSQSGNLKKAKSQRVEIKIIK